MTKGRVLALLVALTVLFIGGAIWLAGKLIPMATRAAVSAVPVSWEERLGTTATQAMTHGERTCTEPETIEAMNAILKRVESGMPAHPYRFRVQVVDRDDVNAFAAPGGSIVVYRGLISKMTSPEELAAVLAHEMQHVVQRHSTKSMLRNTGIQLGLTLLFGDPGILGDLAGRLGMLHLLRSDEQSADDEGLAALMKAGIAPLAMQRAFEHLAQTDPLRGAPSALQYLSTHPPIEERAARIIELGKNWPGPARPFGFALPKPCAAAR